MSEIFIEPLTSSEITDLGLNGKDRRDHSGKLKSNEKHTLNAPLSV